VVEEAVEVLVSVRPGDYQILEVGGYLGGFGCIRQDKDKALAHAVDECRK
jgi:hypothetical protein